MDTSRDPQQHAEGPIEDLLDQIRLARATELARSNCYLEAEALLSRSGGEPKVPAELDLLARIAANQGDFETARRLWEIARQQNPKNREYKECLARITDLELNQPHAQSRRTAFIWAGVLMALLLIALAWLRLSARPMRFDPASGQAKTIALAAQPSPEDVAKTKVPASAVPAPGTSSPEREALLAIAERLQGSFEQLRQALEHNSEFLLSRLTAVQTNQAAALDRQKAAEERLPSLSRSSEASVAKLSKVQRLLEIARSDFKSLAQTQQQPEPASSSQPISIHHSLPGLTAFKFAMPGVTAALQNGDWVIRFEPGLFDRDVHFSIGAKSRLESVAKALVQTQARFKIQILGFAEDEPPTWPWSHPRTPDDLGFQRAQRVAAYLHSLGIFPPDKLTPIKGTASQRPFQTPNRNNRTIVLAVSSE